MTSSHRRSPIHRRAARVAFAVALAACGNDAKPTSPPAPLISSTIALSADDKQLWVVNPDADSVSLLDPVARTLLSEIPLGDAPPARDPVTQRYEPKVAPRALALSPDGAKLYVVGQSSNRLYVVDTVARKVTASIAVPAAPVAVVVQPTPAGVSSDGNLPRALAVYVVSHEAAVVTKIDWSSDTVVGTLPVDAHPWGATLSADGTKLLVSHLLVGAGLTVIDTTTFTLAQRLTLADQQRDPSSKRVPNGQPRGVYMAVPRPTTDELWIPHLLLATGTPQPQLDFESTVFPTITIAASDGSSERRRLLFQPLTVPGAKGSFTDSVSGPRALAFTPDGALGLLALGQSEDVMVFDGASGNEVQLVRPLPSAMLEGIVVDHAGTHAYVDGRNSHDVTVLRIERTSASAPVTVEGAPIDRLAHDPMPSDLRLGQRLFYSANSGAFPITKNFWVACSSCHLEGGTDGVTWRFQQGPRDTPSNAGGPKNTGFLFRQAVRNDVVQYDKTIRVEQGGSFDRTNASQKPLLDALAAFVNDAIPFPQNPYHAAGAPLTDAEQRGQALYQASCASCHAGKYLTDSGAGNPTLDFAGPVVLHDVGTCVVGGDFPDQPMTNDFTGATAAACQFDTPTLRGVFATAPYFHDGSAATLADVVDRLPMSAGFSSSQKADLVAYLKSL